MMRPLLAIALAACGQDTLHEAPHPLAPPRGHEEPAEAQCQGTATLGAEAIEDTSIYSYGDSLLAGIDELTVAIKAGPDYYNPSITTSRIHRSLVRIALAALPACEITGWRMLAYQAAAIGSGIVDVLRLSDVNVWSELGADWYHGDHIAGLGWGGSRRGIGAIGLDFDSVGEPDRPRIDYTPDTNGLHAVELPVQWLVDWLSGARANNGMLLKSRFDVADDLVTFASSESEEHPLTFEIDVSPEE